MTLTTDFEGTAQAIFRLRRADGPPTPEELSMRLDALVEAIELLAHNHYEFPGLPESSLRNALSRARGW
jgi:hypothetical protein